MDLSSNFYSSACKRFQKAPFSSAREQTEFSVKLSDWGRYCDQNSGFRRDKFPKGLVREDALGKACLTVPKRKEGDLEIYLLRKDLTHLEIDAIVNAANETLLGGGGIDQAVHRGAGSNLVRECASLKGCKVGEAKITKGYDLPAKYVIHTVGPILNDDSTTNPKALHSCYRQSLQLAEQWQLKTVAFPCISCGFYGYPIDEATDVALSEVVDFSKKEAVHLQKVIFSVFTDKQEKAYLTGFQSFNKARNI